MDLVTRLVVLTQPADASLVTALHDIWAAGDAVSVIDPTYPDGALAAMLDALAPHEIRWPDRIEHRESPPLADGDALVVTTSGSSGQPKAAVLTHTAVAASADATSAALQVTSNDHWLACLPLTHIGGLSVVTRAIITGTALTVHSRFDASQVDASPATLTSLVGTALGRIDTGRWRRILVGGSAPPPNRPPNCVATYGMTETGSGIVYDGVPLDGVTLRTDDNQQLWINSPTLLRAYRDGTNPTVDGWFPTGDLGTVHDDGTISVQGRRGDVINTGGEKVWPSVVEQRLSAHPGVRDVVVIGRPDAEWGQRVVAIIVPADPAEPPTLEPLRSWVIDALPRHAAPREIELRTTLPRLPSGKIDRRSLGSGGTWTPHSDLPSR
jgi:o-succinylbenzoate---CoA ligase